MSYQGDRKPGDVINLKFQTYTSAGALLQMTALTVSVFKDDSISETVNGVTTTIQFDGRTGCHHVRITTVTDPAFYTAGSDYYCVITAQTPATPIMTGTVVGEFSLDNRDPALARGEPGQAAAPLSISPLAKIDYLYKAWRNIKRQTATGWSLLGDDDTTVHQKATVSDNGTTATKGKIVSGP